VIAVILVRNNMIRMFMFEIGFHIRLFWQRNRCVDRLNGGQLTWRPTRHVSHDQRRRRSSVIRALPRNLRTSAVSEAIFPTEPISPGLCIHREHRPLETRA
jgi:hypothetical protein